MSDCIHYQLGFDLVLWGKIIHLAKSSQKLASVALKKSGLVLKKNRFSSMMLSLSFLKVSSKHALK